MFSSAKPGKVVGPVVPYENTSVMKDAYDPRTFIRSAVLSQAVPSAYCYRKSGTGKQEKSTAMDSERELSTQEKQGPQCHMGAKLTPDIAVNINSKPFFMKRVGVNKVDRGNDRIAIDTNLLQAKAQYGGIGAATTAAAGATTQRKVGTVQYGMSRMY